MENFLKIKKGKIFILLLLFFSQSLFSGYASNLKIDLSRSEKNNLKRKFHTRFNNLLAGNNKDQVNIIKKEDKKRFKQLKKFELSYNQFELLKKLAHKKKIDFISTPFDHFSVDFLDEILPFYKISSSPGYCLFHNILTFYH